MSGKRVSTECKYNIGIECETCECERGRACGWDPRTQQKRRELLKEGKLPKRAEKKQQEKAEDDAGDGKEDAPPSKRERGSYSTERRKKLRALGKCTICGKSTDRPDRYCCSACYQKKRAWELARKAILY